MRRLLIALGLALGACRETPQALLTTPKNEQLPQIYMLVDGTRSDLESLFQMESFGTSFPSRVVRAQAKTLSEARELLQQWNARPVDLLLLSPGLPQKAWDGLSMPAVPRRLTVAWNSDRKRKNLLSVQVDWESMAPFIREFCSLPIEPTGCELHANHAAGFNPSVDAGAKIVWIGEALDYTDVGKPVALSIHGRWPELMRHLLDQRERSGDVFKVNFKSGFLSLKTGPALTRDVDKKLFLQRYKMWSLKNL